MNNQSVTRSGLPDKVNSIRSAVSDEPAIERRSPNKIVPPALRQWNASGGEPQMIGDGMVGSSGDVNQGTTVGGARAGRGQSPLSSVEAGNDRGAKGGRDVVLDDVETSSQKGLGSAARLSAQMRGKTGLGVRRRPNSGPPVKQVSGAQARAAGATPPKPEVECLSQSNEFHELESRMRVNRPSGLGGGRRSNPFSIHIVVVRPDRFSSSVGAKSPQSCRPAGAFGVFAAR